VNSFNKALEEKEQEIKLLVSVLFEIRKKYEEFMEDKSLQQQKAKVREVFFTNLSSP